MKKYSIRKSVAYAYPTSKRAEELGQPGFYIEQSILREDWTWSPGYVAIGHDVFDDIEDPDLWNLFNEHEGEVCPMFLRYHGQRMGAAQ